MADRALPVLKLPSAPAQYDQQDQAQMRRLVEQHWHPQQTSSGGSGGAVEGFSTVVFTFDNGSAVIADGTYDTVPITFDYNIVSYRLIEDCGVAGSIAMTISYSADANFDAFTPISGTQPPTIVGGKSQERTTLDGWTSTSGKAMSQLRATVNGDATNLTKVKLSIGLERTDSSVPSSGGSSGGTTTTIIASDWSDGAGAPSDSNGDDGDFYLNDSTGDVYKKTTGHWSIVANIKGAAGSAGATGATGSAGAAGALWHSGSGAPSAGLGSNGDYYLDTSAGDVYGPKTGGSWGFAIENLVGPMGATGSDGADGTDGSLWYTGTGTPSSGTGVDNDLYLKTSTGDVYQKSGGSWGSPIENIEGPAGAAGVTNPVGACFDGTGLPLTLAGTTIVDVGPMPASGSISKIAIIGQNGPGSVTFGVKKCTRSAFPGSLADITGGHDAAMSSASAFEDSTLTGWTKSWSSDDVFRVTLKAVDGILKQATLLLYP